MTVDRLSLRQLLLEVEDGREALFEPWWDEIEPSERGRIKEVAAEVRMTDHLEPF